MIPRRAIFCWVGGEMPWLRRQALATFRRLNPGWDVDVLDHALNMPARIDRAQWADRKRYQLLRDGGIYFDTDIMFTEPIPEEWLEAEILICRGVVDRPVDNIALLGAAPGQELFVLADRLCGEMLATGRPLGYQALGVELLSKIIPAAPSNVRWLHPAQIVPLSYLEVGLLWDGGLRIVPSGIGIHWFGGDPLSEKMELVADEEWARTSKSLIAAAWRKTMQEAPVCR